MLKWSRFLDLAIALLTPLNLCPRTPTKETRSHFQVQSTMLLSLFHSCQPCSGVLTKVTYMFSHLLSGMHPITVTSTSFQVNIKPSQCFVSVLELVTVVCAMVLETGSTSKPSHLMTCVFSMRNGVRIPHQCRTSPSLDLGTLIIMHTHIAFWLVGQGFLHVISLFLMTFSPVYYLNNKVHLSN